MRSYFLIIYLLDAFFFIKYRFYIIYIYLLNIFFIINLDCITIMVVKGVSVYIDYSIHCTCYHTNFKY